MKRRSKYNNVKVFVDGIKFDSKAEAKRYGELTLLERAGEISHLEVHPKFQLKFGDKPLLIKSGRYPNGRKMTWSGDFSYFDKNTHTRVVEDVKGGRATATDVYKIKTAIFEATYPHIELREVRM